MGSDSTTVSSRLAKEVHLSQAGLESIPNDWDVIELGDLLCNDRGISVGVMYPGNHDPFGVPLIKVGDLAGNRINSSPDFRVTPEKHVEYKRTALEGGELLLTLVGAVGQCAIVPTEMRGWNAARAVAVLRFRDPSEAAFVRWCLLSEPLQYLMEAWSNTTVQTTLNLKEIKQLPLPWPRVKRERDAIAAILGSLEDKIELNSRMNGTLEDLAAAVFKTWFVDFSPIKAKAIGATSFPFMPQEVFDALPSRLLDSALGDVPEGWLVYQLGELIELAYGKALKEENRRTGSVKVFGSNGQVGLHDEALVKGEGVVVGRKGNPGTVTWADSDFFPIDTTFYVKPLKANLPLRFLFHQLRAMNLASLGADSAVPGLNRNMAYMSKAVLPLPDLMRAYSEFAVPLDAMVTANSREVATLTAIRDALLPKLSSGNIRITEPISVKKSLVGSGK
jgi:type I restriction enzyme S subunit